MLRKNEGLNYSEKMFLVVDKSFHEEIDTAVRDELLWSSKVG